MKHLIPQAMDWILHLLFLYKDSFGIKLPTKVDMQLNKETKPNLSIYHKILSLYVCMYVTVT